MALARKPVPARIVGLFTTSEDHLRGTQKTFEVARTTLANARAYGTDNHVAAARKAFQEAAEVYAEALRTHANVVKDYATETP